MLQFANAGVLLYILGPMNREVLLLVALFMGASLAAMVRNIAFNLAGERFVARLRKNVSMIQVTLLRYIAECHVKDSGMKLKLGERVRVYKKIKYRVKQKFLASA